LFSRHMDSTGTTAQNTLRIIPLGGLGEIGLNMMVMEYADSIIIIDCGLMFPEDYMLGIDIVIPDITSALFPSAVWAK